MGRKANPANIKAVNAIIIEYEFLLFKRNPGFD
jgi:hypothetical protein